MAILDNTMFDVVYVAGEALGEFTSVGLRFAAATYSPFPSLDSASADTLANISPEAAEIVAAARTRLSS